MQRIPFSRRLGQSLNKNLATIVYDALVPQETAATGGDLLATVTPLVDGNDVYMESKSGTHTTTSYSTRRWHQNKFTWQTVAGVPQFVRIWTFDTDWVAPGSQGDFWEPVYHAAACQRIRLRSKCRRNRLHAEQSERAPARAHQ